jgi:hypothetical protein
MRLGRRDVFSHAERTPIFKAAAAIGFHLPLTVEFATLRQSSGWAKGEFSSWQKTATFIIWDGF